MITKNNTTSDRTAFLWPRKDTAYQLILFEGDKETALDRAQNLADQLNMLITLYTYRDDGQWGMQCWEVTPDPAAVIPPIDEYERSGRYIDGAGYGDIPDWTD